MLETECGGEKKDEIKKCSFGFNLSVPPSGRPCQGDRSLYSNQKKAGSFLTLPFLVLPIMYY